MDETEKNYEEYKLSDKKHNDIYNILEKMVFSKSQSVESPTAIIVGGQPGSGKGALIGYSKRNFIDGNTAIITTDDYKPFHPKANEIAKKYPTQYCRIVEQDSAQWTNQILNCAIANKYNFIFECTLRNDRILDSIRKLKSNNFNVIVRALAVSYIESLLSAYERYEKQIEARDWGRFFNPLNYNETYRNIPNVIQKIENSNMCDILEIYIRGKDIRNPILIYGNYLKKYQRDKMIFKYKTAQEAIIKARNEDLKNIENIRERFIKIKECFNRRQTTLEEKEGLRQLEEIINNY